MISYPRDSELRTVPEPPLRLRVKLQGSFTDIFDRTNLADPILNLNNSSFGKITSAVSTEFAGARTGQVGVRIEF
jgi:hypothetical protein